MRRKPFAWTSYDDDGGRISAVNCDTKQEALELMINEFDGKDIYIKPIFKVENIEVDLMQYCGKCGMFNIESVCYECERNLQGMMRKVYSISLELK